MDATNVIMYKILQIPSHVPVKSVFDHLACYHFVYSFVSTLAGGNVGDAYLGIFLELLVQLPVKEADFGLVFCITMSNGRVPQITIAYQSRDQRAASSRRLISIRRGRD